MTFAAGQLTGLAYVLPNTLRISSRSFSAKHVIAMAIATCSQFAVATSKEDFLAKQISSISVRCIAAAAGYHKVNQNVLSAILKVESSYNPGAVNRNSDGSVDVGIGQMNSIHFKELGAHGITPSDLMDPCVGSYVAAWHLAKQIKLHGNTWFAIGAYHSVTPLQNSRYQTLVYNAMVDMRVIHEPRLKSTPTK